MSERAQLPDAQEINAPTQLGEVFLTSGNGAVSGEPISAPELVRVDYANAAELFGEHMERVEEQSPLDTLARYSKVSYVVSLGGGGCVGEAATTLYDYAQFSLPKLVAGGIWMAGSALAVGGVQLTRRRSARRRFERNNGESLLTQIGHTYEAYRVPEDQNEPKSPKETVIHWHGAAVPKGTSESAYPSFLSSIRSISRLAEQHAVSRIVVDTAVLKTGMPELAAEETSVALDDLPQQSLKSLLKATDFEVDDRILERLDTLHDLRSFTPQELRSFVEEQLGVGGIDTLITQLAEADRNDPMTTLHDRLTERNADRETIRVAILAASEQALVRNLESTPQVRGQAAVYDSAKSATRNEVTCRIIGGQVEVRRTTRTAEGMQTSTTMHPLDELLPISDVQRVQFDEDPTLLSPQQRKLIIYERLYHTARTVYQVRDEEGAGDHRPSQPVIADKSNLVQSALVNNLLSPVLRSKKVRGVARESRNVRLLTKVGVTTALAVVAGGTVAYAHAGIIQTAQNEFDRGYAAATKSDKDESIDYDALFADAWKSDARTRVYAPIFNFEGNITFGLQDFLGSSLPESWQNSGMIEAPLDFIDPYQGGGGGSTEGASRVGNIDPDSKNMVEWYLDPHNMNSEGYWGAATYSVFASDSWQPPDKGVYRQKESLPTTVDQHNESYIGVRRHLDTNDVTQKIALPILAGTRPVAANIDGHPVSLEAGGDGSYVLTVERPGKLTYYVDDDTGYAEGLRATTPAEFYFFDDELVRPHDIWKQKIPDLSNNERIRVQQEMTHIQKNFTYSLEPIGKSNPSSRMYEGVNFLTAEALDRKMANCNLAATIIIADNVWLNYADGWRNSNASSGKQQILSSHEAHAWAVDGTTRIYDATPGGGDADLEAFFDESTILPQEKESETDSTGHIGLVGGVLAGGLAAQFAYRRRKSIVKATAAARTKAVAAAVTGAAIAADMPGSSRSYALGARDARYAHPVTPGSDNASQQAQQYLDASRRRAQDRSRLADIQVAPEANLNARLQMIGLSAGLRLAIRARLALRRFVQSAEQRNAAEALASRVRKNERAAQVMRQNAERTNARDEIRSRD